MRKLWIARDRDGSLYLWDEQPYRYADNESWEPFVGKLWLNDEDFPEVTWENSPMEVELKLKEGNGN